MKNIKYRTALLLLSCIILSSLISLIRNSDSLDAQNSGLALKVPPLVNVANAEGNIPSIANEAGIAAYFQADTPLNLESMKSVYRVLESETPNYLIGSVPVTDYDESQDVHVYAHADGFVMAYYLKDDPVAKIINWRTYNAVADTIPTKLESVLATVAVAANAPFSVNTLSYYDFRYPEATDLMFIADYSEKKNDSFEVTLPGTFVYYERSVSYSGAAYTCYSKCYLDDAIILDRRSDNWPNIYFALKASQLLPDTPHVFRDSSSESYTGLVIVYKKQ